MCVYDVSDRESFQSFGKWLKSVRSSGSGSQSSLPGLLVANKVDLREGGINSRAEVDSQEGLAFAQANGLEYFECSASTGKEVDLPFHFIASQFHQRHEDTMRRAEALSGANAQGQGY